MKETHDSIKHWDEIVEPAPDYHLNELYQQCVTEIGVQQSKRDQTIAFFIAVCSFVIPAILEIENMGSAGRGACFFFLFALGAMLCRVVARYRIYKEVYWLTVRTLSRLFGFKCECINKEVVQQCFAEAMHKNFKKTVVFRTNKKREQKPNLWKTLRLNRGSAELILYKVIVLMTGVLGFLFVCELGSLLALPPLVSFIAGVVMLAVVYFWMCMIFCRMLCETYRYCVDSEKDSFNKTYAKAWFLHMF